MASIIERGNSFSVVYYVKGKSKWETYRTKSEAQARKTEIEYQQTKGTFVPPSMLTVADLMKSLIETYGKSKWGYSTYTNNISLINNYIVPCIGSWPIKNCTTRKMTEYFDNLREQEAVRGVGRKAPPKLISERNIYEIYGLLNIAFRLAVEWEELGKHPLTKSMKPQSTRGTRSTWDGDTAKQAIALCENLRLKVYIHLALGCSMRIGEISGLQWSKVILDAENNFENAYIKVDTQLSRIDREAYSDLIRRKDQIKFIFPDIYQNKNYKTLLVLKTPKTISSIRTVYLPSTTAKLIHEWKRYQNGLKLALGEEFQDYDLVMTLDNGRPVESSIIGKELDLLIEKNNLPNVDFHSLRHTSTSVKLVITGGDIKAVQGDNGHATSQMTTDVYAEIFDSHRKANAKKFDESFFGKQRSQNDSNEVLTKLVEGLLTVPNLKDLLLKTIQ